MKRFLNKPWHIYDEILFRTYCNYNISRFLDIFKILDYSELKTFKIPWILKYSSHRTLCNLGIFANLVYSSPSIGEPDEYSKVLMYDVAFSTCNTGIFRTRVIFRTLSYTWKILFKTMCNPRNINTWHIQNPSYIHNTVKHLSRNKRNSEL